MGENAHREAQGGEGEVVLPTGTVTLLLADVEGSTRLWEAEPEVMAAALARLAEVVDEVVGGHGGARPVEQGEGDSFVLAFTRASDAAAAALDLQLADLAPLRLRIGIHTGEVALRDEGNYMGPAVNRAARLRDLGHGGQTLVSQAAHDIVVDRLPDKAALSDLGTHRLKDLARPEHVHQLGHPELTSDFPPLRSVDSYPNNLPVQLTSFIGRERELVELRRLIADNRLVTLTGAGGAGKTRLALQLAAEVLAEFPDGVFHVDLAPLADPDLVPAAVVRAVGLPDEVNRSAIETITRHTAAKRVLFVLDNCEHLIGSCAALADTVLRSCPSSAVVATSREPVGLAGEMTWRVPSLGMDAGAVQLFADRACRARGDFELTDRNRQAVAEICERLDGLPLAIELAAARARAFSPDQILTALQDRFRLLTGGARTAVPRQQTLQASVDWSHRLLTNAERTVFRRLAVFPGSFDLAAAQAIAAGDGLEPYQVLDLLALLVDKSLVVADEIEGETRYRLLQTVRHYALEHLDAADEAGGVRHRHRDHYFAVAMALGDPFSSSIAMVLQLERELDNLRAAFWWTVDEGEADQAGMFACLLFRVWFLDAFAEGRSWFERVLTMETTPMVRALALATSAWIEAFALGPSATARGAEAVAVAREIGAPTGLTLALCAAGVTHALVQSASAEPLLREAVERARTTDLGQGLSTALWWLGSVLVLERGDVLQATACFEESLGLAEEQGDRFSSYSARYMLALADQIHGDLREALALSGPVVDETRQAQDRLTLPGALAIHASGLALLGDVERARAASGEALQRASRGVPFIEDLCRYFAGVVELASGDAAAARAGLSRAWGADAKGTSGIALGPLAEAELALGDVDAARTRTDAAIGHLASEMYWQRGWVLTARARVAIVDGDIERAEVLAHEGLTARAVFGDKVGLCDSLELLASLAAAGERNVEGARLLGAAHALRERIGYVRFEIHRDWFESLVAGLRAAMTDEAFDTAWAEGVALSLDEAVAYAQRGRGERKRPTAGWASLTPAELDVVRLVAEGLPNKEIAARLFISPRTVQAHLTHVYAKLGLSSRVQLAKEAAARATTPA